MDVAQFAYAPLAAGFSLGFVTLFFGAFLFGAVGWIRELIG